MRHFGSHANALAQRRVPVDGFADVDSIGAHLDCQWLRLEYQRIVLLQP